MHLASLGAALTLDGEVYGWGDNGNGQVGTLEKGSCFLLPKRVGGLAGACVALAASNGGDGSFAISAEGVGYSWGKLNSNLESNLESESKSIGGGAKVIGGLVEVSERSERALMKTRILAMNPAKWLQT